MHGGTIGLESRVGEGSTVTVRLPISAGEHHTEGETEARRT
jgi:signal transduction histidine kinase